MSRVNPIRRVTRTVRELVAGPSRRRRRIYLRSVLARPSDPGTRVLIFGQGRSGTTVLESLICSTGLFVPNDEPLIGLGRGALWPTAYVVGLSRDPARQGVRGNYICHVKPDHLDRYRVKSGCAPADMGAFVHSLVRDRWQVVHVQRADVVRQVISEIVGRGRGQWHKHDDRPENLTVHVDREEFFERIRYNKAMRTREREVLRGVPHFSVIYERDLLDPAAHEQVVDAFLGHVGLARSGAVATELRKINTRPLSAIVENYEELAGWIEDLGLEDSRAVDPA
jgi:LPS sulfotransferase NodH